MTLLHSHHTSLLQEVYIYQIRCYISYANVLFERTLIMIICDLKLVFQYDEQNISIKLIPMDL